MNNQNGYYEEITENLLEPKKDNKNLKILIIVTVISVMALLALIGFLVLRHRYHKDLENGNNFLNLGNYEAAYDSYKEATRLNPFSQVAYEGLAKASLKTANMEDAKKSYDKLYEFTKDDIYKTLSYYADYGNIGGNLTNGGNICIQGYETFVADNSTRNAKIYRLTDQTTTELASYAIQNTLPVSELNAWGDKLYFLVGEDLYSLNMGSTESHKLSSRKLKRLMIYKGNLYYLDTDGNFYKSDIDGTNENQIYTAGGGTNRGWNFLVVDNYAYLICTDLNGTYTSVQKVSLEDKSTTEILKENNKLITTMAYANEAIYFQYLNTSSDLNQLLPYADGVYVLDLSNDKNTLLMNPLKVSSVNTDGIHLYYMADGIFYRCNMDTGGIKQIGTGAKPSSPTSYTSRIGYSIGLTPVRVYLTSSTLNGIESLGINNTIMSTLATGDNPSQDYTLVNLTNNENKGYSQSGSNTNTVSSGTHRYELVSGDVSWEEAVNIARSKGGYLAHIDSQSEFNTIVSLLNQRMNSGIRTKEYYIGGRRNYVDQTYRWVDEYGDMYGESVENTLGSWFWYPGEPSYQDPNNPTYEEPFLSIMYVDRIGQWVGNDTVLDISASFPEFTSKVGYIIEYE